MLVSARAHRSLLALISLSLLLGACEESKQAVPSETPPAPQPPTQSAPIAQEPEEAPTAEAAPPTEDISDERVQAAVDEWVRAQNEGDLESYKAAYAGKFYGVKRVGEKTSSFDRLGWLKDRERMFKKAMQVTAGELDIQSTDASAVVTFEQSWASGDFKDVGPKQLVLIKQGSDLKISREEMLRSNVGASRAAALTKPLGVGVYRGGEHAMMVVKTHVSGELGVGAARSIERAKSAYKLADESKLEAEHRAMIGKTLAFMGRGEKVCEGKVTGFAVYAAANPHFGNMAMWEGREEGYSRQSDAQVARGIYELAQGRGTHLVAVTDASARECEGAAWGYDSELSPKLYTLTRVKEGEFHARTLEAFQKLAGHKEGQQQFERQSEGAKKTPWSLEELNGVEVTRVTKIEGHGRTFALANAHHVAECDGFWHDFWALWEIKEDGRQVLLSNARGQGSLGEVLSVSDVDGDGTIELFTRSQVIQRVGPVHQVVKDAEIPDFDCPC